MDEHVFVVFESGTPIAVFNSEEEAKAYWQEKSVSQARSELSERNEKDPEWNRIIEWIFYTNSYRMFKMRKQRTRREYQKDYDNGDYWEISE
ncbi:MAG: hypothetical protein K2J71_03670 [Oscillospiraceae bacterium]|nr:hypothetical protein [Oscillospiraceae bacterium]